MKARRLHRAAGMRRTQLLASLLLVLATFPLSAGSWGSRGSSRQFLVSGDRLYAAEGRGVAVYDISDPAHPLRIDVELSDDETVDLALFGDELVTATAGGVERFRIGGDGTLERLTGSSTTGATTRVAAGGAYALASRAREMWLLEKNGEALETAGTLHFSHDVSALAVVGGYAYVAVDSEATYVYSLPDLERVFVLGGSATGFALQGTTLWLVQPASGLAKIDVSNPAAPVLRSRTAVGVAFPLDVAAAGSHVYAFEPPDKVHLYDTSGEPRLVSTIREWATVIGGTASHVFVSGVSLDDEKLTRETGSPVRVFDATDLAAPHLAGEFVDRAGPVSGVWTDGSVAYVVDPPYLRVLDVSRTEAPFEVVALEIPNIQDHIRVKNGLAILYGRAFVNMLDVSRPLSPRYLGTWDAEGHPPGAAAIADGRFVEANEHSGLHLMDYANPSNPLMVGWRKWHYHDVAASDDAIYALQRGGYLMLEIVDRTAVVDRGGFNLFGEQLDIAPANAARPAHLLVRQPDGLRIYSLREDRYSPKETAFVAVDEPGLFGTGDGLAWVTWQGMLQLLELDHPERGLTPSSMRVTAPMQISVAGEKVVVADRYSVRVYGPDTPSPGTPRRRSTRH
jgi:hypothetical protein